MCSNSNYNRTMLSPVYTLKYPHPPLLQQGSCVAGYWVGLSSHFTSKKILFQNYGGQPLTQQLNHRERSVQLQPFRAEQNAWGKNTLFSPSSGTLISFQVVPGTLAKSNTELDSLPS